MAVMDPIADMLTKIRNAIRVGKQDVLVGYSKLNMNLLNVMKTEGFVDGFQELQGKNNKKEIKVILKYINPKENIITGLKRVSKPSRRIYVNNKQLPKVLNGLGIALISTSQGILSDRGCRKMKVGGEVICYVW